MRLRLEAGLGKEVKLELGSGQRPTRGYEHQDLHPFPHIEHVGEAWMLDLPDNSCEEVLALAFIEHLTYDHALDTFRNVHRMLLKDGVFLFDVPDYPKWCRMYLAHVDNRDGTASEATLDHCRRTLFGWQRFPGDEHFYGWDEQHLRDALTTCGFAHVSIGNVEAFKARTYRQRFDRHWDAHLYVTAYP